MLKIKQILVLYENGNVKGYNFRAFVLVFKNRLKEYLSMV